MNSFSSSGLHGFSVRNAGSDGAFLLILKVGGQEKGSAPATSAGAHATDHAPRNIASSTYLISFRMPSDLR